MKKFFAFLAIAGMVTFVACGPSAEEKAEKARQDSIRLADSIAQVEAAAQAQVDSLAKVAADSIAAAAHADSVAKKLIK
ncbi:MAG TPA: hypothetical protein PK796_11535 [Bacteroidales bacterium]|jgi:hypothetical protein|nr:hypothetical protein [Bacteroidales bacterium]